MGCYADFTFPALGTLSQPKIVNKIYYPSKDRFNPKSYDSGAEMQRGRPQNGLILLPGPILFDFKKMKFDDGRIEPNFLLSIDRLRNWQRANIHVRGCPEWIFIKLYTHSAREYTRDALFSNETNELYSFLSNQIAHGKFHLHFVTAREAFNIAKAAGAGEIGEDPMEYFDYQIAPPRNR